MISIALASENLPVALPTRRLVDVLLSNYGLRTPYLGALY